MCVCVCEMLDVSTWWQSTARHSEPFIRDSAPLNLSVSPLPPLNFLSPLLLLLPLLPLLSFLLLPQAFVLLCCSDTFLKHVEERERRKSEGEKMESRRKKSRGGRGRKLESGLQVISLLEGGEGEKGRVSQQRSNREWQRWRDGGRMKASDLWRETPLSSHRRRVSFCSFAANFVSLVFISSSWRPTIFHTFTPHFYCLPTCVWLLPLLTVTDIDECQPRDSQSEAAPPESGTGFIFTCLH